MEALLQIPMPQRIKTEDDNYIDDQVYRTPRERVEDWGATVKRLFARLCYIKNCQQFETLLKGYHNLLEEAFLSLEDVETLQLKTRWHIHFFLQTYKELKASESDDEMVNSVYLRNMEEILAVCCNLQLSLLKVLRKKNTLMSKRDFRRQHILPIMNRINHMIVVYLLGLEESMMHVLMKLDPCSTQLCREVCCQLFNHFFIKRELTDLSEAAFCRAYIIFNKWKELGNKENDSAKDGQMERLLCQLYHRTPESIETNPILKEIRSTEGRSSVELILHVFETSQSLCRSYFDYLERLRSAVIKQEPIDHEDEAESVAQSLQPEIDDEVNLQDKAFEKIMNLEAEKDMHNRLECIQVVEGPSRDTSNTNNKRDTSNTNNKNVVNTIESDDDDVEIVSVKLPEVVCVIEDSDDDEDVKIVSSIQPKKPMLLENPKPSSERTKKNKKPKPSGRINISETPLSFLESILNDSDEDTCDNQSFLESINIPALENEGNAPFSLSNDTFDDLTSFLNSIEVDPLPRPPSPIAETSYNNKTSKIEAIKQEFGCSSLFNYSTTKPCNEDAIKKNNEDACTSKVNLISVVVISEAENRRKDEMECAPETSDNSNKEPRRNKTALSLFDFENFAKSMMSDGVQINSEMSSVEVNSVYEENEMHVEQEMSEAAPSCDTGNHPLEKKSEEKTKTASIEFCCNNNNTEKDLQITARRTLCSEGPSLQFCHMSTSTNSKDGCSESSAVICSDNVSVKNTKTELKDAEIQTEFPLVITDLIQSCAPVQVRTTDSITSQKPSYDSCYLSPPSDDQGNESGSELSKRKTDNNVFGYVDGVPTDEKEKTTEISSSSKKSCESLVVSDPVTRDKLESNKSRKERTLQDGPAVMGENNQSLILITEEGSSSSGITSVKKMKSGISILSDINVTPQILETTINLDKISTSSSFKVKDDEQLCQPTHKENDPQQNQNNDNLCDNLSIEETVLCEVPLSFPVDGKKDEIPDHIEENADHGKLNSRPPEFLDTGQDINYDGNNESEGKIKINGLKVKSFEETTEKEPSDQLELLETNQAGSSHVMFTSTDKVKMNNLNWNQTSLDKEELEDFMSISGPVSKISGSDTLDANFCENSMDLLFRPQSTMIEDQQNTSPNVLSKLKSPSYETIEDFRVYYKSYANSMETSQNHVPTSSSDKKLVGILKKPEEILNNKRIVGKRKKQLSFDPMMLRHDEKEVEEFCQTEAKRARRNVPVSPKNSKIKKEQRTGFKVPTASLEAYGITLKDPKLNIEPVVDLVRLTNSEILRWGKISEVSRKKQLAKAKKPSPDIIKIDYNKASVDLSPKDRVIYRGENCVKKLPLVGQVSGIVEYINNFDSSSCDSFHGDNYNEVCNVLTEEFTRLNFHTPTTDESLCLPLDPESEFSNSPKFLQDADQLVQHCLQEATESNSQESFPNIRQQGESFLSNNSNFYESQVPLQETNVEVIGTFIPVSYDSDRLIGNSCHKIPLDDNPLRCSVLDNKKSDKFSNSNDCNFCDINIPLTSPDLRIIDSIIDSENKNSIPVVTSQSLPPLKDNFRAQDCKTENFSLTNNANLSKQILNNSNLEKTDKFLKVKNNIIDCGPDITNCKPTCSESFNLPTVVPEYYDLKKDLDKNDIFNQIDMLNFEDSDYDTHLPLKKRKLPLKEEVKQEAMKTEAVKEEISYPATPMISIAEVEELSKKYKPKPRPFKTPAERKEMPPLPADCGLPKNNGQTAAGVEPSPIITDQFNINNHTYNNPTINYHMNHVPLPFLNIASSYYTLQPFILPFNNVQHSFDPTGRTQNVKNINNATNVNIKQEDVKMKANTH